MNRLLQTRLVLPALLLLAGVLFLSPSAVLDAKTVDCVPSEGCPEGMEPPACCQPPPCEVYEHIKIKKAIRSLYNRKGVKERVIKQAGGDNRAAAVLLDEWVKNKASKMGSQLRCKWEAPYSYPGQYETKSWCEIFADLPGDNDEKRSKAEANDKVNSCSEFIDAIWTHEGHHLEKCNTTNSTVRANEPLTVFAAEEREGYRLEIDSLKANLEQYWHACSVVADAETERQIAAAGISVLRDKASKQTPKKPRASPGGK
ncbi:MAG TPA: hypothetical protein VI566_07910 [Xanthomonadales bacterium]|nr:hypothetical protein [Xanthomonadales bacterium]